MKQRFYILNVGDSQSHFIEVSGEMVDIGAGAQAFITDGSSPRGSAFRLPGYWRVVDLMTCLLYTSPSPRDATLSRMPSSA